MNFKPNLLLVLIIAGSTFGAQQMVVTTKDWKTFATKNGKFSVKAPKGWAMPGSDDLARKAAKDKINKNNPQIAALAKNSPKYDLFLAGC